MTRAQPVTRAEIVERLARGLYEREKVRDRTSHEKQAEWEELNVGRKATRLHYADELFEILFGGFGFSWEMVDALRSCVQAQRAAAAAPASDGESSPGDADPHVAAELAECAIEIIVTLLPPRISEPLTHGRSPSPPSRP